MRLAPLAVPVVIMLLVGYRHRTTVDDGFIYYRIVQQVVHGNGPVFNAGERVEAFTSPAWVAVLSLSDAVLPIRLEWIGVTLGLGFTTVGLCAAMAGALRLTRDPNDDPESPNRMALPVGALVAIAPVGMWVWFTSGLETGLVWAWLGVCLYLLARWANADGPVRLASAAFLGLGWVVRPELVVFSALFMAVLLIGQWRSTTWRSRFAVVGVMVAVPAAYQVFRMGYYGSMVANTAIVKEGTAVQWNRGTSYLRDFVDPYWLWIPAVALVLAGYLPLFLRAHNRQRLVAGAFLAGATLLTVYVVVVGGDYYHARFFVPAFFAVCAPVGAVTTQKRFLGLPVAALWAVVALVFLRPPQWDQPGFTLSPLVAKSSGTVTTDDWGWGDDGRFRRWYHGSDLYIETGAFGGLTPATFRPADDVHEPAVVVSGIGVISYALGPDVRIIDTLNLADPIGSHFRISGQKLGLPGHDKLTPSVWLAAELAAPGQTLGPDAFGLAQGGLLSSQRDADFGQQVDDARAALACPPLRRLEDASSGHLGPRRFLRNLVQAPANTRLRIPPDPAEARRLFC